MTLPIKKRINTELFINRKAALYEVDGQRWECSEGDQPLVLVGPQIEYTVC